MGTARRSLSLLTLVELREILKTMKANGRSWRDISKEMYPHEEPDKFCAILWKIDKGSYEPLDNKLRTRLRLPLLKEIEACPNCNVVHVDRCPKIDIDELPTRDKEQKAMVIVVVGEVPPGAQIAGFAQMCIDCAKPFITNHPRRRKCFICSPFKGRKP